LDIDITKYYFVSIGKRDFIYIQQRVSKRDTT
jgi:hypothetical protein